jgi:PST family polysaccharide transporter
MIIKSQSDYLYVPLLNSIGAIIASIISTYIVFKKEHIRFLLLPIKEIYIHFKESVPLFVSITSVQIYVSLNKLIAGIVLGMSEVAIYDLGEKIATSIKIPIQMISQAVFPKISRERNIAFINKIMFLVDAIVIIEYIVIFIFSQQIVSFFIGEHNDVAVTMICIISLSAIITPFNIFLASNRLIPFGYNSVYMKAVILGSLFYLCYMIGLWFSNCINLYTLSIASVCVELFVCIVLIFQNKKRYLLI